MQSPATVITNLLCEFGTLNNSQIADYLGDYGIGSALKDMEAEGVIRWNYEMEGWELVEPPMEYDDSMDGDAASALASVGWGTDEDYGCGEQF